jgi:3-hydroxyacyl-[acyl-carrier-protein] dehydratase
MLNNYLYKIDSFKNVAGNIDAAITIDTNHEIFKGHFPNQPVLPGVCMMQIFKELLEKAINQKLFLYQADSSKFLSMVDPFQTPQLFFMIDFTITDNNVKAGGVLKNDTTVFLKLNNYSFRIVQ